MSDIRQEDKLTQVLEAVEHPERYTDEQLQQLLSDEACADYYRLMCDAASAYADSREADGAETETAWQRLVSKRSARVLTFRRIAAILLAVLLLTGISYAAIWLMNGHGDGHGDRHLGQTAGASPQQETAADRPTAPTDTICTFQDAELQDILTEVAAHYQLRTDYRSEQARHIRFYVKWNKAEGVSPIMERLNMSEKVKIQLADDLLIVE